MKIHKKIWIGLVLASVIAGLGLAVPKHASAATQSDADQCAASLKFTDIAHIECTTSQGVVTFVDKNPSDEDDDLLVVPPDPPKVTFHKVNYKPTNFNVFCDADRIHPPFLTARPFSYDQGITRNGGHTLTLADATKPSIGVTLNIGYTPRTDTTACERYGGGDGQGANVTDTDKIRYLFRFQGSNITSLTDVSSGDLSGKNYGLISNYNAGSAGLDIAAFSSDAWQSCSGELVIMKTSGGVDSAIATAYKLGSGAEPTTTTFPDVYNLFVAGGVAGCKVSPNVLGAGHDVSVVGQSFRILGTPPPLAPPGTTTPSTGGGGVAGPDEACYASGWSLGWIACPMITAAQTTANAMYGFVEDQLKFTVQQNCTKDSGCNDSLGGDYKSVHSAWSNFRILVSGLVVILLLVMVISQAIGTGPFDAYTVRKMLPRLVMGVILIQISWPLFSWVINTVDDLGRGLADLMYAPFGGADKMNLFSLLGPFGDQAITFNWVGIGALAIFGVVAPFVILGIILTVLVAIFVGFLTLLFRKILIILALILVPIALISWMMPNDGLRIYWKKWWENFSKALMMFPLIIAIIAGGRIFAKIGSGGHDFVGFFIVLVGFFGPLFILPKTFKWGGTVMTMAGNGIQKAQERSLKKPKEFLGERQKEWSADRARLSQERFANNVGFNWRRPWKRPIDLVKSGQMDPTRRLPGSSRIRRRAMDSYVQSGEESYQKDLNAAEARIVRERQTHRARGGDHDLLLQAIADGRTEYNDPRLGPIPLGNRSPMERMAARKQLSKLGAGMNWRYLENYYEHTRRHGTDAERAEMRKFFDDNVETIMPKLRHIYSSVGQAADADPGSIAQMHGVEVEAIISNLSQNIETGQTWDDSTRSMRTLSPDQITGRQTQLTTFLQNFNRAVENSRRGGPQLENGTLRAVKGFLDRDDAVAGRLLSGDDGINTEARHGRAAPGRQAVFPGDTPRDLPLMIRSGTMTHLDAEHTATINGLRDSLAGIISEDGYVRGGPGSSASAPSTQTVEVDLHPGERISPGGVVIAAERRTRPPEAPEPEEGSTTGGPPSSPPTGGGSIPPPIQPEDFGPDGRFPPPNIPPGPGNV